MACGTRALRYDDQGKPRAVLTWCNHHGRRAAGPLLACCAVGAAAERLAKEIERAHPSVTSGSYLPKKRTVKVSSRAGWNPRVDVDRLSTPLSPAHEASPEYGGGVDEGALPHRRLGPQKAPLSQPHWTEDFSMRRVAPDETPAVAPPGVGQRRTIF